MSRPVRHCWPSCFLPSSFCCERKCCACRKRRRNRIAPSKPIESVVFVNGGTTDDTGSTRCFEQKPRNNSGETNLYFQGDEVIFCPSPDLGVKESGSVSNGDCGGTYFNSTGVQDELVDFLSTVFIQLSKTKQLRVIHIKTKPTTSTTLKSSSVQNIRGTGDTASSCLSNQSSKKEESDEDEGDYWFTIWSHRPKLKNTFVPKPKLRQSSTKDVVIPLHARATFHFEDITTQSTNTPEVQGQSQNHEKEILRKTFSSPILPSLSQISPPASPKLNGGPRSSLNFEMEEWPISENGFSQDVDPSNDNWQNGRVSFINPAFHIDPEEFSRHDSDISSWIGTSSSSEGGSNLSTPPDNTQKTESIIDNQSQVNNGNCHHLKPIQSFPISNGIIRSHSSPSRMVTSDHPITTLQFTPPPPSKLKPLLFFIHGISGSSDTWKSQFRFFHDLGYEIVAPDLLGHGHSSMPSKAKHYAFESLVEDLVTIFDHFVPDESRSSVIIGHGYGACMGTVLSRIRSQNIILLISVSGGGPTPLIPYGGLDKPLLPFRLNLFGRRRRLIGRFDNPDLGHILPPLIHQHMLDGQVWIDGDATFHRRISVPTLLVYGMRDTVVSLVEECEMERTIPKAFLELLPSAGHMVMWDEPYEFNRMLMKFIQAWT